MSLRRFFSKEGQPNPSLYGGILQWMLIPLVVLWLITMGIELLLSLSIANAAYDRELERALEYLDKRVVQTATGPRLKAFGSADMVTIADDDGQLLYQLRGPRDRLLAGTPRLPPPAQLGDLDVRVVYFRDETVGDERLRVAYEYIRFEGSDETYSLQVASSYERRRVLAFAMTGGQLSVQLLIVPIALMLVWLGVSRGIKPLDDLIARVRSRASHDLSPLDPHDAPEEVRAFITSINDLMDRLRQSMRAQELFVADAAHQLRTPIAGLKTQAELALRHRDEDSEHTMRQIAAAADRASRTINQLLALARAEAGAPSPKEPLNLTQLARETTAEWVSRAMDKSVDLAFDAPDSACVVSGNDVLLRELINNLVDNAIRYTGPEGLVRVRIAAGSSIVLEVEDTGIGIAPEDRERVFDRFYRVLGSGAEGTGLGLAIVKAICNAHGATLSLQPGRSGRGTLLRVEFARFETRPASAQAAPPRRAVALPVPAAKFSRDERRVIFASSLGTVFEWYDFYLYATLAPFFAALFFPKGNETAALLSAFATYAAGFLVRPFGGLVFGRIGDLVGRKYTFLITIVVMGGATFAVGLLPTFEAIGWAAPILLVTLRLIQGLALGGEYGGAATYVAEHAAPNRRGFDTGWIQTTATLGFLLSLAVIGMSRLSIGGEEFASWGWRIPFWCSIVLLIFSAYIRLKLEESPVFQRMKAEGKGSRQPLTDSFLRYPNNKYVLLALLGATAGQGVIWYTGQFYALFFLQITLKLDYVTAYTLVGLSLLIGTPFFVVFGWLSDRIGRLKIILAGCLVASLSYFPLFGALTQAVNPGLAEYQQQTAISVAANDCHFHLFVGPWSNFSDCDRTKDFLTKQGLSFKTLPVLEGKPVVTQIGDERVEGWNEEALAQALAQTGYPGAADPDRVNFGAALTILVVMVLFATMVYGPIAAFLVELFPTRIRYTSMSLPYHIGNGWFGGMLPLTATAMVAASGDIYYGLWYPIAVALLTLVIGLLFLKDTRDQDFLRD